jgi:acetyltransferase-like isoleucine patch superfamily enzyme
LIASLCPWQGVRSFLYRLYGVRVGRGVWIGHAVSFDRLNPEAITIGDRTSIGGRSIISAHQYIPSETSLRKLYPYKVLPVVIENDVYMMPGVSIAPGVRIGHHSVIATGAVVYKDVKPYSLVVGYGFRIAKELPAEGLEDSAKADMAEK